MKAMEIDRVVLEGVLIPVAWRPSGEVLDVGLMTFDEDEYRIASGTRDDLCEHLREHVRLSGVLGPDRTVTVDRMEVLGATGVGSCER